MKSYLVHLDDKLHAQLKQAALAPKGKYTIQDIYELGVLLVLVERGVISSREEARALGANEMPAALLGRIIRGEKW